MRLRRGVRQGAVLGFALLVTMAGASFAQEGTEVCYPDCDTLGTWAFEDLWPQKGDYDLNDLVVRYQVKFTGETTDAIGQADVLIKVVANGSGNVRSGFGVQLPLAVANVASATLTAAGESICDGRVINAEAGQAYATYLIFDDVQQVLKSSETAYVNTWLGKGEAPGKVYHLRVVFSSPQALASLTLAPGGPSSVNPFLFRTGARGHEIHLPGFPPTDLVDGTLFNTCCQTSGCSDPYDITSCDATDTVSGHTYMTAASLPAGNNLPWVLDIPYEWKWPQEKIAIVQAYQDFASWAGSGGSQEKDWFTIDSVIANDDEAKLWTNAQSGYEVDISAACDAITCGAAGNYAYGVDWQMATSPDPSLAVDTTPSGVRFHGTPNWAETFPGNGPSIMAVSQPLVTGAPAVVTSTLDLSGTDLSMPFELYYLLAKGDFSGGTFIRVVNVPAGWDGMGAITMPAEWPPAGQAMHHVSLSQDSNWGTPVAVDFSKPLAFEISFNGNAIAANVNDRDLGVVAAPYSSILFGLGANVFESGKAMDVSLSGITTCTQGPTCNAPSEWQSMTEQLTVSSGVGWVEISGTPNWNPENDMSTWPNGNEGPSDVAYVSVAPGPATFTGTFDLNGVDPDFTDFGAPFFAYVGFASFSQSGVLGLLVLTNAPADTFGAGDPATDKQVVYLANGSSTTTMLDVDLTQPHTFELVYDGNTTLTGSVDGQSLGSIQIVHLVDPTITAFAPGVPTNHFFSGRLENLSLCGYPIPPPPPDPLHCSDGQQNPTESDVDCGGECTQKCADGQRCGGTGYDLGNSDNDCQNHVCSNGHCGLCFNGNFEPGEADTDCGGVCAAKCADGRHCNGSSDCISGVCNNNVCAAEQTPAHCSNSTADYGEGETDTDCGGECAGCQNGQHCGGPADCQSSWCEYGWCGGLCYDHVQDNGETDTDCGGPCANYGIRCQEGQYCSSDNDCVSMSCDEQNGVCDAGGGGGDHCTDSTKNDGEVGVDCAGSCTAKCGLNGGCLQVSDCQAGLWCSPKSSMIQTYGSPNNGDWTYTCTDNSCLNGIKDNDETDVDCGGSSCDKCQLGQACAGGSDCLSGLACTWVDSLARDVCANSCAPIASSDWRESSYWSLFGGNDDPGMTLTMGTGAAGIFGTPQDACAATGTCGDMPNNFIGTIDWASAPAAVLGTLSLADSDPSAQYAVMLLLMDMTTYAQSIISFRNYTGEQSVQAGANQPKFVSSFNFGEAHTFIISYGGSSVYYQVDGQNLRTESNSFSTGVSFILGLAPNNQVYQEVELTNLVKCTY